MTRVTASVYDPAAGTVTIPVRIMRQIASAMENEKPATKNVPGIVRERDGDKAAWAQQALQAQPKATVAQIANDAHQAHPEVSIPNFRYLVNKLRKQPSKGRTVTKAK